MAASISNKLTANVRVFGIGNNPEWYFYVGSDGKFHIHTPGDPGPESHLKIPEAKLAEVGRKFQAASLEVETLIKTYSSVPVGH